MAEKEEDKFKKTVIVGGDEFTTDHAHKSAEGDWALKAKLICTDDSLLEETQKGLVIILDKTEVLVGRASEEAHVNINHTSISRMHARLYPGAGRWGIEDLGSTNGIFVNGERLKNAWMKPGDIVKIASVPFRFVLAPIERSEPMQKTLMFSSSSGATEAILSNDDTDREETSTKRDQTKTEPSISIKKKPEGKGTKKKTAINRKKESSSAKYIIIAILSVALIVSGFMFYRYIQERERVKTVASLEKKINRLVTNYDEQHRSFSRGFIEKELMKVRELSDSIDKAVKEYPDEEKLIKFKVMVMFFDFERNLKAILDLKGFDEASRLTEATRDKFSDLNRKHTVDELSDALLLTEFAELVVQFKIFINIHPDPSVADALRPGKSEITLLKKVKREIIEGKRTLNQTLSVYYPYFDRLLTDTIEKDFVIYERWRSLLKAEGD